MSKNLWELRKQRKMTVKQLAAKSGVPAKNIYAYEAGEPIKIADLGRLARVLYVDKSEIKIQSDPVPKTKPELPKPQVTPAPPLPAEAKASPAPSKSGPSLPAKEKKALPLQPATEGQLHHMRGLMEKLGLQETAVAAEMGKPLDELTFMEARTLLRSYDLQIREQKKLHAEQRPPGTRRSRSFLPEGVDEFEVQYLLARLEAGEVVTLTLLNEQSFTGKIIGFSPYNITIKQADGTETTVQKLALAYYHVAPDAQGVDA